MLSFKHVILPSCLLLAFSVARGDDFRVFRIPSHRVTALAASLDGWYSNRLYRPLNGRDGESGWNGDAGASLFNIAESDRYLSQVRASANLSGWINNFESRRTTTDTSRTFGHDDRKRVSEMASASWQGRVYPWTMPLGLQANVNGSADWAQNWESQTWTDQYPNSRYSSFTDDETWSYYYSVGGSVMAGWGRVRDASGIYAAKIMEQRLRETGVLSADLQVQTIQRLAELIYRRNDFVYRHERNDRFYWQEVEQALKGDPAFHADRFDAYHVYLAADPFFPSGYGYRPIGYFVGPTAQLSHSDHIARTSHLRTDSNGDTVSYNSSHSQVHYDRAQAGISASYDRPFGLKWQFDVTSTFLAPVRPDEQKKNRFDWTTRASLSYVITDRWVAAGDLYHRRTNLTYPTYGHQAGLTDNSWSLSLGAWLAYYVEDHWFLFASADFNAHGWRERFLYPDARGEDRSLMVRVGLSHFFIGAGYSRFYY